MTGGPGGGATNGSTHGSQTVVTGTPIPPPRDRRADSHRHRAPGSCARRNCKVNLDDLRWDCPHLDCEPKQARGNPRNLQLDETGFSSDRATAAKANVVIDLDARGRPRRKPQTPADMDRW